MIKVDSGDGRVRGFFDLLRNVLVLTDEDDERGLIELELRVYPALPDDKLLGYSGPGPIPEVPFDQVGTAWFVERVSIDKQRQQWRYYEEESHDIDYSHPFIRSLEQAGFFRDEASEFLQWKPTAQQFSVDEVVQLFITHKPGAKSSPMAIWQIAA